jgi:putative nucleotidyltransferase with HDIG domain
MEQIQRLPSPIAEHGRAVARVALRLAQAVKAAGAAIDVELVRTAALLHDIARTRKNHAQAGAQLLADHGFSRLAPVVGTHMDLDVRLDQPIDAAQVVFLADKLMDGDRYADVEQRFRRKMEKYGSDSQAVEAIARRLENALLISAKVQRITGRSIEAIMAKRNTDS